MNLTPERPDNFVSTHGHASLSRLGIYRLKKATQRRELAIEQAHATYHEEVRAVFAMDRSTALELQRGEAANYHRWDWRRFPNWREPSITLAHPFMHALETGQRWWNMLTTREVTELAREIRRGH
jgi:hypothetical protein